MLSQPICLVAFTDKLIAKQKVLACSVEYPCKCFTATVPFCWIVKWLIIKGSQKSLIRDKGEEEEVEVVVQ